MCDDFFIVIYYVVILFGGFLYRERGVEVRGLGTDIRIRIVGTKRERLGWSRG